MKNLILTLALVAAWNSGMAQDKYSNEYGKVTRYEMSMTQADGDPDAEAVVIYELGDYRFTTDYNRGFLLNMERTIKIKILKPAGIKYANFEIPYYLDNSDYETVSSISGTTYNEENNIIKKTELDPKKIYEEKAGNNMSVMKIALPDVRPGSVIEFKYTILTPFYFNIRRWEFQKHIPVVLSKLNYYAIPYYEYTYIMIGANKFDIFNSTEMIGDLQFGNLKYKELKYEFGMKNLPAFRDEEYVTSEKDYMTALNFQMSKQYRPSGGSIEFMTTWPEMCNELLKNDYFGKYLKKSEGEAKKIIAGLHLEGKEPDDKIRTIVNYVKLGYNWNGIQNKYAYNTPSTLIKNKTGNSAEINLFTIGLLKEAGFDAYPVILSTRENGQIKHTHPFIQFFNYVIGIVRVGDKVYAVDATEPLLSYNELPERCLNVQGLVVKPKAEEWITTSALNESKELKSFDMQIIPGEGKITARVTDMSQGQIAYRYRTRYMGKNENLQSYLNERNIIAKGDIEVENGDNPDKQFIFKFTLESQMDDVPAKLFVSPFCNMQITDNPFKQTFRKFPVDLISIRDESYNALVRIPQGYKADYIPTALNMDNDLMTVQYTVLQSDDKISITAHYRLKKSIYPAADYLKLKESFAEIIKRFSDMIVLVKE